MTGPGNPAASTLTVRCFAKINTELRVLGRRPDGYHDLDTEFVAIELADDLVLAPGHGFTLAVEGAPPADVPVENNLVLRAARALQAEAGADRLPGADLILRKRVPAAAGLGGGSSDAAGALAGLDRLHHLGIPASRLAEIALGIGSDVPYFLKGGRQRGSGRGEILTALPDRPDVAVLLLKPRLPLATARVFQEHAAWMASHPGQAATGSPVRRAPPPSAGESWAARAGFTLHDDLADAAIRLAPEIAGVAAQARRLLPEGAVAMTGSGPTLFVLLPEVPEDLGERLASLAPVADTWLTRTVGGAEFHARRFA